MSASPMIPIAEMAHKKMNSQIVGCGIYLKRFGAYIKYFNVLYERNNALWDNYLNAP
jgi:hypothetical protein